MSFLALPFIGIFFYRDTSSYVDRGRDIITLFFDIVFSIDIDALVNYRFASLKNFC